MSGAAIDRSDAQPAYRGSADAPYWAALADGRVTMQHCRCGAWHWPAVWRCGECGEWDPAWEDIALDGEVFSWQTCSHRFGGTEGIPLPYTTLLVALPGAGGRRLLGLRDDGGEDGLATGVRVAGHVGATEVGGRMVPAIRWQLAKGA